MNNSFLYAKEIKKGFVQGSGTYLEVLKGITASFEQGKSYSIMGVSGTGKSTLLHILGGIDTPSQGTVFFDGLDINKFNQQYKDNFLNSDIGFVFQEPYLIKEFSVLENIMLKGLINGMSYPKCKSSALELLNAIGLVEKAYQLPSTLSGGQQQRVAILRAIFNKPKFLLADEPTGNLDEHTRSEVTNLLFNCQKEWGMGLIICTHDKHLADATENILELHDGLLKVK